jgi:hypothetical protein
MLFVFLYFAIGIALVSYAVRGLYREHPRMFDNDWERERWAWAIFISITLWPGLLVYYTVKMWIERGVDG